MAVLHAQITTIHDSAPNCLFSISELTRLIAGQLTLISQESTVSLACACRRLEEPALSTLWETQSSLFTVLAVLLDEPQDWKNPTAGSIVRGPNISLESSYTLKIGIILVQDHGGSVTGGLEQIPALRVLDAPTPRRRMVGHSAGDLPQVAPQLTCWRMVSGAARSILAHDNLPYS